MFLCGDNALVILKGTCMTPHTKWQSYSHFAQQKNWHVAKITHEAKGCTGHTK
jgi:hypothetical protein